MIPNSLKAVDSYHILICRAIEETIPVTLLANAYDRRHTTRTRQLCTMYANLARRAGWTR